MASSAAAFAAAVGRARATPAAVVNTARRRTAMPTLEAAATDVLRDIGAGKSASEARRGKIAGIFASTVVKLQGKVIFSSF